MRAIDKINIDNFNLNDEEILELLNIENLSKEYFQLIYKSNEISRKKFGSRGYVFTQIGINAAPCSMNCGFCSMGAELYSLNARWEKNIEELKNEINRLQRHYFDDLFLMTTADYSISKFLKVSEQLKFLLKPYQRFVANIGDFDYETAKKLKSIGFTGAYHINRLREGEDTHIPSIKRERTIDAILKADLELYYCIEPIGPEHSYEELLAEIKRARDLKIRAMAVMRRIPVPGTPLFDKGKITAIELTKIAAVTNLVVNPIRSMNVHEPIQMALLAGINQLYAEVGANPRDTQSETQNNRGFTQDMAWDMLEEGGYYPAD
jgi:biotin synthase